MQNRKEGGKLRKLDYRKFNYTYNMANKSVIFNTETQNDGGGGITNIISSWNPIVEHTLCGLGYMLILKGILCLS